MRNFATHIGTGFIRSTMVEFLPDTSIDDFLLEIICSNKMPIWYTCYQAWNIHFNTLRAQECCEYLGFC